MFLLSHIWSNTCQEFNSGSVDFQVQILKTKKKVHKRIDLSCSIFEYLLFACLLVLSTQYLRLQLLMLTIHTYLCTMYLPAMLCCLFSSAPCIMISVYSAKIAAAIGISMNSTM